MKENYFIKAGYVSRKDDESIPPETRHNYWNTHRIRMAAFYQYHVYSYAKKLIVKKKFKSVIDIGCGTGIKLKNLIYPVCPNISGIDQESVINHWRSHYSFGRFYIDDLELPQLELTEITKFY